MEKDQVEEKGEKAAVEGRGEEEMEKEGVSLVDSHGPGELLRVVRLDRCEIGLKHSLAHRRLLGTIVHLVEVL